MSKKTAKTKLNSSAFGTQKRVEVRKLPCVINGSVKSILSATLSSLRLGTEASPEIQSRIMSTRCKFANHAGKKVTKERKRKLHMGLLASAVAVCVL